MKAYVEEGDCIDNLIVSGLGGILAGQQNPIHGTVWILCGVLLHSIQHFDQKTHSQSGLQQCNLLWIFLSSHRNISSARREAEISVTIKVREEQQRFRIISS
uniref:Uncharacterized protein n=1 Tax=Lutzomyia longipalpis TaxID=7200 RepID=A0A1B0C8G0_LUTLO